ncbi:Mechanosensitive ion channel family protein [Diplocarpon rosae]|nr:Mechanosensitive ion channel family protein [Diplocarpon rosae]
MGAYDNEGDIPLTNVQTRSSSTGARRKGEGLLSEGDMSNQPTPNDDEKKGLFHHGRIGRRKVKKANGSPVRVGTDGEEITVTGVGRLYNKIVGFSVVTRYLVYVAPIAMLLAAPVVIFAVVDRNARFAGTGVKAWLFWLWILILWLSIWVSKLISKAIPFVFMFLCGVVSSGTRKYATILRAVEIPLSLVGWAITALVTFTALTSTKLNPGKQKGWISVMNKILAPALIASILFLVEKMLIQLVSINYHKRSFDGRIKDSKRNIHLLELLYDASRQLFPAYCPEFIEEDYLISDSIEAMLSKNIGHKRSGSATPMRIIGNIGRVGDKVTSIFGNIASEITGKQVFNPTSSHSVIIEALEKTKSSEALAKRLWMSFVVEDKDALYAEDIEEVLGQGRQTEAAEIFKALDNDGNGDISLEEMIMKVVELGRERKAINASMRDVGQAIGVLDSVLVTILSVIVLFIFVAFQNTNFVTMLATAGTTLLSLSFVFAATTQEFLGSCIFLFVKHPYDVGDRVDIDHICLVVEQISLLYTVFKRIDNMKMVQVPNIVLNNLWVENVTRSKAMKEQLEMFISFDTTLEDIELLRAEMEAFVRSPENSRDFQPDIILEATGIGSMDKLQLKVEIRHKSNWANESVRAARRSKFMCALVLALRKIPIYAPGGGGEPLGGHTNPGYSVVISDAWAAEAREKADAAKEGLRLVPTPKATNTGKSSGLDDHLGSKAEESAAESINKRRPGEDPSAAWSSARDHVGNLEQQQRSTDIDNLKTTLLKRASTRGRRRPGEHLPPTAAFQPSVNVTAPSPRNTQGFQRRDVVDEEAELDDVYGGGGYSSQTPVQGGVYPAQGTSGYGLFPPPGQQQRPGPPADANPSQGKSRRLSLEFKGSGSGA